MKKKSENKKISPFTKFRDKLGISNSKFFGRLQFLGKAMVFPIIVLPIAAIFLRLGNLMSDTSLAGIEQYNAIWYIGNILTSIGQPSFDNLPIIFAIGLGFGLSKENRGEAALAAAVAAWVLQSFLGENVLPSLIWSNVLKYKATGSSDPLAPMNGLSQLLYTVKNEAPAYALDLGVFGGLIAGGVAAFCYNKWSEIKMPAYLSFMEGRRFIPVVSVLFMVPIGILFSIVWPWVQLGLMKLGLGLIKIGYIGTFLHTLLKSILVLFGLHNVLNAFLWFQLPITGEALFTQGSYIAGQTYTVNGDINAFLAGINGSGLFQVGSFPEIMGGYWGITLAIIFCAKKENKTQVTTLMLSICLASSLTGVGEPLILPIWYASPVIYLIQSFMNVIFGVIPAAMGIRAGFGFSAGWVDYAISFWTSWKMAQLSAIPALANPLWLMVIAAGTGFAYFIVFYTVIKKMNLKTLGREDDIVSVTPKEGTLDSTLKPEQTLAIELLKIIKKENVERVDNCATRLRLEVVDNSEIDVNKIKQLGVYGVKKIGTKNIQIIIGSGVESVTNYFQKELKKG